MIYVHVRDAGSIKKIEKLLLVAAFSPAVKLNIEKILNVHRKILNVTPPKHLRNVHHK